MLTANLVADLRCFARALACDFASVDTHQFAKMSAPRTLLLSTTDLLSTHLTKCDSPLVKPQKENWLARQIGFDMNKSDAGGEKPIEKITSLAELRPSARQQSMTAALIDATKKEKAQRAEESQPPQEAIGTNFSSFLPPPINPFQHLPEQKPQIYSLRHERIKQLPDEELMQYLTRERVPKDGMLDDGAKMAITMELMRRQSKKLEPVSWWRDRNYLAALAAAVCGAVATVLVSWDFFSK